MDERMNFEDLPHQIRKSVLQRSTADKSDDVIARDLGRYYDSIDKALLRGTLSEFKAGDWGAVLRALGPNLPPDVDAEWARNHVINELERKAVYDEYGCDRLELALIVRRLTRTEMYAMLDVNDRMNWQRSKV